MQGYAVACTLQWTQRAGDGDGKEKWEADNFYGALPGILIALKRMRHGRNDLNRSCGIRKFNCSNLRRSQT
jgi:hypothetical protein